MGRSFQWRRKRAIFDRFLNLPLLSTTSEPSYKDAFKTFVSLFRLRSMFQSFPLATLKIIYVLHTRVSAQKTYYFCKIRQPIITEIHILSYSIALPSWTCQFMGKRKVDLIGFEQLSTALLRFSKIALRKWQTKQNNRATCA